MRPRPVSPRVGEPTQELSQACLSCPSDSFGSRGRKCGSVIQPGWHEPGALYASPARSATRRPPSRAPIGWGLPGSASGPEPGKNAFQPGFDLRPLTLVPAQALGELPVGALDLCQPEGERLTLVFHPLVACEDGLCALSAHGCHCANGSRVSSSLRNSESSELRPLGGGDVRLEQRQDELVRLEWPQTPRAFPPPPP